VARAETLIGVAKRDLNPELVEQQAEDPGAGRRHDRVGGCSVAVTQPDARAASNASDNDPGNSVTNIANALERT
jgi:hypothetical protein